MLSSALRHALRWSHTSSAPRPRPLAQPLPQSPAQCMQSMYHVLHKEEISRKMNKCIEGVTSVLNVPRSDALRLLREFKWRVPPGLLHAGPSGPLLRAGPGVWVGRLTYLPRPQGRVSCPGGLVHRQRAGAAADRPAGAAPGPRTRR